MKRKWLAVGIILLFLGTSIIPATAQDCKITKPSETLLLKKVVDLFRKECLIKHPILHNIVYGQIIFRQSRGLLLVYISIGLNPYNVKIIQLLLGIRAYWLLKTTHLEIDFWTNISNSLSWNWNLPDSYLPDL